MIAAKDLIAQFQKALDEKWGYIWGTHGSLWTAAKQKASTREMTVKYGAQWIGHTVSDCSGMFYWAFRQLGGYMYHGSNTMWNKYCTAQGELKNGNRADGKPLKPGTAVFQKKTSGGTTTRSHVGLYIGAGTVIEAHGTRAGVITSKVSGWAEWGELKGVDYSGVEDEPGTGSSSGTSGNTQDSSDLPYGPPAPASAPSVASALLRGACIVDVPNDGTVNLRSAKTTGSGKITTIREGETVNVLSDDGTWSEVEYTVVRKGFVMSKYLRAKDN